jgi:hypothetical protein
MNRENSQDDSSSKHDEVNDQITIDDIKYVRSVMEKVCQQIKPKTSNTVMWGLICMTLYISAHFLVKNHLYYWIKPLQILLILFGVIITVIQARFLFKKFRQQGFVPQQLLVSLLYGFIIIFLPVLFFDLIGLFEGMYCGPAFIYALTANAVMVLMGVLHSKLWFTGTVFVIAGILTAFIIKEYSLLILGIATGTGIILSALIVDLYYRKMGRENA